MLQRQPSADRRDDRPGLSRRLIGRLKRARHAFLVSGVGAAFNSAKNRAAIKHQRAAIDEAERLAAAEPNNTDAWRTLANAYFALKQYEKAIAAIDQLLKLQPDDRKAWTRRERFVGTLAKYAAPSKIEAYSVLNPQKNIDWNIRAGYLSYKKRFGEASEASDHAVAIDPNDVPSIRTGIHARLHACDWRQRALDQAQVSERLRAGEPVITPFNHRAFSASEAEHLLIARLWAERNSVSVEPLWQGEVFGSPKIKLAYLSSDFREHPVGSAMVGCFEHHDKSRFDLTAISTGPGEETDVRRRIVRSFDRFIDVQRLRDDEVAALVHQLNIDILIDLNGYTAAKRTEIVARRPAPIQVNYLGFPGTMAAPFIDYVIADPVIIPRENERFYSEKIVKLPHTYLPNDTANTALAPVPSRADAGLPETGFVFASFNMCHKIAPDIFDIWMRLLRDVPGSVLWLRGANPYAEANLWREAQARGIAPQRIIFAPRIAYPDHLARHQLAGLFLDTSPFNAHTTAADALWAGLPVVTYLGESFPARVAGSLLHAIGMPELATSSPREYEELARALARDPQRLAAMKAKLSGNRARMPLFDTARFTRNLEAAYTMMWERQQRNLPPENLDVVENLATV
jgi:predicted O-linked N-acetylglucosamine transferase (SPINDLY family)